MGSIPSEAWNFEIIEVITMPMRFVSTLKEYFVFYGANTGAMNMELWETNLKNTLASQITYSAIHWMFFILYLVLIC